MAGPWEQFASAPQPEYQTGPWQNFEAAPAAPSVPASLIGRLSNSYYSHELAQWTAGELKQRNYGRVALGTLATFAAGIPESLTRAVMAPGEAYQGKIKAGSDEEIARATELGMWAAGMNEVPAKTPGGVARIADTAKATEAHAAAKEVLKPVDDALAANELPHQGHDAAAADLGNAATLSGAHAEMERDVNGADQRVGYLPNEQDFADAAKVIGGEKPTPATADKLQKLYDEQGIHPAEVAHDAAANPETHASMVSPDKADMPREYAPTNEPYFTYDDRGNFAKSFSSMADSYKKTFQPELVSDAALTADPVFARYKSATQAEKDGILARAEEGHQFWRPLSDTDRLKYMDLMERGKIDEMPPEWQAHAKRHRELLSEAYKLEQESGSKGGYIDDYFPHIWQSPDRARGFVNAKVAQLGPKWFQKERSFDLVREGLDAGLRLKSTNPEDLVTLRLLASADMRERVALLNRLAEQGLAKKAKEADTDLAARGWQPINAPDRNQWMIAPDVQPLWENAVNAKGFWSNEGVPGNAFRGYMKFKNVWVPIKLALSGFHALHVLHINWNEGLARAWVQMTHGNPAGAAKSAAEGFYGGAQAAVPGMPHLGKEARAAWKIAKKDRTPEQQATVDLMNEGGFVPELSEQLRIDARHSFEDALDKGQWLKAVPMAVRRTLEKIQKPLFEEWIPNLKAAAYLNDARALLARRPELLDDATQRAVALRTIAKSIDNRFGEMFYGGLFWNRYIKDGGIGSFLSLGWNLGFAREFLGGPLQSVGRLLDRARGKEVTASEATIADAQNKLPFVIAYASTAMLISGMMTMAFTGQMPEGLDWIFARVGGQNPDGSPRRVTNMFYTREVPMLAKHIQSEGGNALLGAMDMLYDKTLIEPFKELLQNRDYYGSDIWDENGPLYAKAIQGLSHVFREQFNPISISGARRAYLSSGQWGEAALAMMGFGPAPAYVSRTATENRIEELYKRHVAPYSRPMVEGAKARNLWDIRSKLMAARQNHDRQALHEAAQEWMAAGGSRLGMSNMILGIPGDVGMFRALPEADQQAIMESATDAEKAKYRPYLKSNISGHAADLVVEYQHEQQAGNYAAAAETHAKLQALIATAVQNGEITSASGFRRSLVQQIIARRAPELSAILALPKRLRGKYAAENQWLQ